MRLADAVETGRRCSFPTAWLIVHTARAGSERQQAHQMLASHGDDSFESGEVFVLVDPSIEPGGGVAAAAWVVETLDGERELCRFAVADGSVGGPFARRLIEEIANILRARGIHLLHVSPADAVGPAPDLLFELRFRHRLAHPQLTLEL